MCEPLHYDFGDINLDFLDSSTQPYPQKAPNAIECDQSPSKVEFEQPVLSITNERSDAFRNTEYRIQDLAKRIADIDLYVEQIKTLQKERNSLQDQLNGFQTSADDIRKLYLQENEERKRLQILTNNLSTKCELFETEIANKTLLNDQLQSQLDEINRLPVNYNELAQGYLRLFNKYEEDTISQLPTSIASLADKLRQHCKTKSLKVPEAAKRIPKKRNLKKEDSCVQCDIWNTTPFVPPPATAVARKEMRSQGTQHISTTTTRSTSTLTIVTNRSVGTCFPEPKALPPFDDIVTEIRRWNVQPLSPIIDLLYVAPPIESGHSTKSIGTCTVICNVQRQVDYIGAGHTPLTSIKRSNSRPPSRGILENVKCETITPPPSVSPVAPSTRASSYLNGTNGSLDANMFEDLWQVFGQMLFSLIGNRLGQHDVAMRGRPGNSMNQQEFYQWLRSIYENGPQERQQHRQQEQQYDESVSVDANRAATNSAPSDAAGNSAERISTGTSPFRFIEPNRMCESSSEDAVLHQYDDREACPMQFVAEELPKEAENVNISKIRLPSEDSLERLSVHLPQTAAAGEQTTKYDRLNKKKADNTSSETATEVLKLLPLTNITDEINSKLNKLLKQKRKRKNKKLKRISKVNANKTEYAVLPRKIEDATSTATETPCIATNKEEICLEKEQERINKDSSCIPTSHLETNTISIPSIACEKEKNYLSTLPTVSEAADNAVDFLLQVVGSIPGTHEVSSVPRTIAADSMANKSEDFEADRITNKLELNTNLVAAACQNPADANQLSQNAIIQEPMDTVDVPYQPFNHSEYNADINISEPQRLQTQNQAFHTNPNDKKETSERIVFRQPRQMNQLPQFESINRCMDISNEYNTPNEYNTEYTSIHSSVVKDDSSTNIVIQSREELTNQYTPTFETQSSTLHRDIDKELPHQCANQSNKLEKKESSQNYHQLIEVHESSPIKSELFHSSVAEEETSQGESGFENEVAIFKKSLKKIEVVQDTMVSGTIQESNFMIDAYEVMNENNIERMQPIIETKHITDIIEMRDGAKRTCISEPNLPTKPIIMSAEPKTFMDTEIAMHENDSSTADPKDASEVLDFTCDHENMKYATSDEEVTLLIDADCDDEHEKFQQYLNHILNDVAPRNLSPISVIASSLPPSPVKTERKKRGRKRKSEMPTTIAQNTVCKRSERLRIKQADSNLTTKYRVERPYRRKPATALADNKNEEFLIKTTAVRVSEVSPDGFKERNETSITFAIAEETEKVITGRNKASEDESVGFLESKSVEVTKSASDETSLSVSRNLNEPIMRIAEPDHRTENPTLVLPEKLIETKEVSTTPYEKTKLSFFRERIKIREKLTETTSEKETEEVLTSSHENTNLDFFKKRKETNSELAVTACNKESKELIRTSCNGISLSCSEERNEQTTKLLKTASQKETVSVKIEHGGDVNDLIETANEALKLKLFREREEIKNNVCEQKTSEKVKTPSNRTVSNFFGGPVEQPKNPEETSRKNPKKETQEVIPDELNLGFLEEPNKPDTKTVRTKENPISVLPGRDRETQEMVRTRYKNMFPIPRESKAEKEVLTISGQKENKDVSRNPHKRAHFEVLTERDESAMDFEITEFKKQFTQSNTTLNVRNIEEMVKASIAGLNVGFLKRIETEKGTVETTKFTSNDNNSEFFRGEQNDIEIPSDVIKLGFFKERDETEMELAVTTKAPKNLVKTTNNVPETSKKLSPLIKKQISVYNKTNSQRRDWPQTFSNNNVNKNCDMPHQGTTSPATLQTFSNHFESPASPIFEDTENSFVSLSPQTSSHATASSETRDSPASPPPEEIGSTSYRHPLEICKKYFSDRRSILLRLIADYRWKRHQIFAQTYIKTKPTLSQVKLQQCIKKFLEYTEESGYVEDSAIQLIRKMHDITHDLSTVTAAIIEIMRKAPRPERELNCRLSDVPPKYLGKYHRLISYVVQHLQARYPVFYTELVYQIEKILFNYNIKEKQPLNVLLNLTQLYLVSLSLQPLRVNPARLFVAKCLYYYNLKAGPMIYEVLCRFPTVLPHREEHRYDGSNALITVITHLLMSTKYDMDKTNLRTKELLSKLRFEYHFEPFIPQRIDVVNNLVAKIKAGKVENVSYSLALLCKRMPQEKVEAEIIGGILLPLLSEYYRHLEDSDAHDVSIACLFDCISIVMKPFRLDTDITPYFKIISRFLKEATRPRIQEAAVQAILRCQRFGYVRCFNELKHFKPWYVLQPRTMAMLQSFVYRKSKKFLLKLKKLHPF